MSGNQKKLKIYEKIEISNKTWKFQKKLKTYEKSKIYDKIEEIKTFKKIAKISKT